jgi:integrase
MPKAKAPHSEKRLSATFVRTAPVGRHTDGAGLYLVVKQTGAKHWLLRAVLRGKRIDFGLGSFHSVSLSDAREAAFQYRRKIFAGLDPRVELTKKDIGILTFSEAALKTHQELIAHTGRNGKHKDQWINSLKTHAFPYIGHLNVDEIHARHVIEALKPIWNKKQETARRVRQRIGVTLDWSTAHGYRTGDNPAGAISAGLSKQKTKVEHFKAMKHDDVPFLFDELEKELGVGAVALRFTILTALRSGTVRQLRWDHINACEERPIVGAEHIEIPGDVMKTGKPLYVPLSSHVLKLLEEQKVLSNGSELIFPSPDSSKKSISDGTMRKVLQKLRPSLTVHGFRSTFRDWIDEETDFSDRAANTALALAVSVYRAKRRSFRIIDEMPQNIRRHFAMFLGCGIRW